MAKAALLAVVVIGSVVVPFGGAMYGLTKSVNAAGGCDSFRFCGPPLVVLIVIDGFRYDYLVRFREHFVDGGFERLLRDGATLTNARYRHATTDTCPGHAAIATGTWGDLNGIVANEWFDAESGRTPYCVDSGSPRHLLRQTVGDLLKQASGGHAQVISVAGKREAAILLGGQRADAAYWSDKENRIVTSNHYRSLMPRWAREFNAGSPVSAYAGKQWERILPIADYSALWHDDEPAEDDGIGRTFPHPLGGDGSKPDPTFHAAFKYTPFANQRLAEFAMQAIREEGLGRDETTDLIAVSLSANDGVGHRYGPDSHEVFDIVVRTDRLLARLFEFLEQEVGLDRTLIVLTADHGVAPLPEVARKLTPGTPAGRISETALVEWVTAALDAAYGRSESGPWVVFHDYPNLFLNERALSGKHVAVVEAAALVKRRLEELPGIERAFTRSELERWRETPARDVPERVQAMLHSFHPERSGHVVYHVLPFHLVRDRGTNHGTYWDYDTHVPLLWLGGGLRPGVYSAPATPADIAPTLVNLLKIPDAPEMQGRVLVEMLPSSSDPE